MVRTPPPCFSAADRPAQSVPPTVLRRLMRELSELKRSPPEGVRVAAGEDSLLDVTGIIAGPGESCPLRAVPC